MAAAAVLFTLDLLGHWAKWFWARAIASFQSVFH